MPNETKNYGTVITTAGAALIAKCILNGGKVNIKTAAAGDGGGEYYEPTVAQTALRGKKWEGDVASAAVSTTNANMIDVKITIDDSVGGFTIREMGLFDDDGTLIAICNTPDTEKVSTDGGVSGKLTMIMHIVVADASVVSFTITPALDTVSRAEMESALAEHNTNGTSHSDIRALALNAVQQGDVYTKPEVNALVGGAVNEHNNSDTAHASIRVDLTGLDSRLKTLELKYGTNVTGSSFEVTFVTLTDVVVTGVWNEELGRIEFSDAEVNKMRRGTNPVLTFELPEAITISALYITFQQNRQTVLEKDLTAVTYDKENGIITLPLSQEDTLLFSELEPVWVQLRLRDNLDNAIASEPMRVNVGEIFKDGVI